jgi:predicted GNAT family acetyltransferase
MINIQHREAEKNGVFEAWLKAKEESACTEPVQAGEMTYVRPTPERMIIDHTRVFDGFEGRGIARQLVLAAVDFARANSRKITPVCSYALAVLTRTEEYKDIVSL